MKKLALMAILMLPLAMIFVGCSDDDNPVVLHTPLTPQGVYSVTGDHAVYLYFNGVYDQDVKEYVVYRSNEATTNYLEIDRIPAESNPNLDLLIYEYVDSLLPNGTTFYYAVASVDFEGNVSDLSAENVYDTPRPQDFATLFPKEVDSTVAGLDFSWPHILNWNDARADVYLDQYQGITYINVEDNATDIMDMGYTSDFKEISVAPTVAADSGWSALGFYEIALGHTYVIWTRDDHFAKMRVAEIYPSGSVRFDWAYQTAVGNPELAPSMNPPKRPAHDPNFLHKQMLSASAR
jgi:hypothetical protein